MSTPNDRDPAAQEPDPTGMRALLASLPDPGPMPAEVTERITASLQRAQQHRLGAPGPEGMPSTAPERTGRDPVTGTTTVTSLASRRRTRVPHLLAAVASVAAVGIAGVVVLDQVAGDGSLGDMAAVYWNGNDTASSDSAAQGGAESGDGAADPGVDAQQDSGEEGAPAEPAPDSVAEAAPDESDSRTEQFGADSGPSAVRVIAVTRPLTSETFALGVSIAVVTAADDATVEEARLSAPAAAFCLRTTGESPAGHDWTVSAIELDGADAVLVVASGDPDRAWALSPDCALGTEGSEVLLGPVDLP